MRRKLAAGNWKMNGTSAQVAEIESLIPQIDGTDVDILICPPATLIDRLSGQCENSAVAVGGQDCHANTSGAHTGDISCDMLTDAGATYVLTGHSERRTDHGETDAIINAKSKTAQNAGLIAVVCIGETLDERDAGTTLDVVATQIAGSVPDGSTAANTVVAYEPVWAIGTGKVPTTEQIAEVHAHIRSLLVDRFGDNGADMRVLYGGSVKASNAADIFAIADVDGALVGGASLKAADFAPIVTALADS